MRFIVCRKVFFLPPALAIVSLSLIALWGAGFIAGADDNSVANETKLLAQSEAVLDLSGDNAFVLRQSWWRGILEPGNVKIIQVQMFRRNEYRFWMAVPDRNAEIAIHIYNSDGELIETPQLDSGRKNVVATSLKPEASGLYFLRISLSKDSKAPQDWAVIYGYR